jgi:hypothetical protein
MDTVSSLPCSQEAATGTCPEPRELDHNIQSCFSKTNPLRLVFLVILSYFSQTPYMHSTSATRPYEQIGYCIPAPTAASSLGRHNQWERDKIKLYTIISCYGNGITQSV